MASEPGENNENTCVVCFKSVYVYSIGNCDHMVCYECSTRMRVLCRQNECPICRQDLPKVVFTTSLKPFNEIRTTGYYEDKKYNVLFQNKRIQHAFYKLMEHSCSLCPNKLFKTFQQLYDHMKREHDLQYCDLCVEHLKIFTSERRCYTRSELAHHRKKGDLDDKSHRGHPMCEFCQIRFMDNDFLYRHLRKDHLYCHFCDADGRDLYYSTYDYLREHFREEHYLCEEGACIEEKFTPVFRSEIDLKAHKMAEHGKMMGKAAAKQARMLELEFTLKPRPRQENTHKGRPAENRSSPEGAAALIEEPQSKFHSPTLDPNDFPSLPSGSGTGSGTITVASVPQRRARTGALTIQAVGRRNAPLAINDENFPVLGEYSDNSQGTSVRLNINQDRTPNSGRSNGGLPSRNVSIHVNHKLNGEQKIKIRQDDFPALTSDTASIPSAKWVSVPSKSTASNPAPKPEKKSKLPTSDGDFPELKAKYNANLNFKTNEPLKPNYVNIRSNKGNEKNTKKASSVLIPVRDDGLDILQASIINQKAKVKKKKSKNNIIEEKSDTAKKKDDNKEIADKSKGNPDNPQNKSNNFLENSGTGTKLVKPLPSVEDWFGDERKLRAKSERKEEEEEEEEEEDDDDDDEEEEMNACYNSCTQSSPSADEGAKKFDLANFNSNNVSGSSSKIRQDIKAPPGFDVLNGSVRPKEWSKPPPGFAIDFPCSNDFTFTNSSGQRFPIPTNYNYIPPLNFETRNKNLVMKVFHILSNDSNLDQFKSMSALFRQDLLSAEEYCNHCVETMGEDGFRDVFPELLILLPDINKQQELYQVFSRSSKSEVVKAKLQICEICRQVLCKDSIEEHADQHTLQENFPLLMPNNWM